MSKIFCVEFQRYPHKIFYPYITNQQIFSGLGNISQKFYGAIIQILQKYRQMPDIRRNKSQNLDVSRLVLLLSLPIYWTPVRMKM